MSDTIPTKAEIEAKWGPRLRTLREEIEAKAAAGDELAKRLLAELGGEPLTQQVNVPTPTPPPHWQEREPGEEG